MNRQIFLETLRKALYGKVSEKDLAGHMNYYESYLDQEISRGRGEQEILEELGDPRLIARTLIETSGTKTSYRGEYTIFEDGEIDTQPEYRMRRLEGWKAKVTMIALMAVLILVLVTVFHIVAALLPFLVVAGIIGWMLKRLQR